MNEKFDLLLNKKDKLNSLFNEIHKIYPTQSSSQIIPVLIGDAQKTKQVALSLQKDGFFVLPINPPTVPFGTSRLRLSLCADMESDEIRKLLKRVQNAI